MVGIINYGMGNLRSVEKAFERIGAEVTVLTEPGSIEKVDRLVLPGVGAFADGMEHLTQQGWIDPVRRFIDRGRPFLGICLGMQLLFDGSQEDATDTGLVAGMKILPGQVVRFPQPDPSQGTMRGQRRLKVPHMGWNMIQWSRDDPLFAGLDPRATPGAAPGGVAVYFVHSYYVQPTLNGDPAGSITSATADYGGSFCASVWRENIWATQFHPEKSQKVGLTMIRNFASLRVG